MSKFAKIRQNLLKVKNEVHLAILAFSPVKSLGFFTVLLRPRTCGKKPSPSSACLPCLVGGFAPQSHASNCTLGVKKKSRVLWENLQVIVTKRLTIGAVCKKMASKVAAQLWNLCLDFQKL